MGTLYKIKQQYYNEVYLYFNQIVTCLIIDKDNKDNVGSFIDLLKELPSLDFIINLEKEHTYLQMGVLKKFMANRILEEDSQAQIEYRGLYHISKQYHLKQYQIVPLEALLTSQEKIRNWAKKTINEQSL